MPGKKKVKSDKQKLQPLASSKGESLLEMLVELINEEGASDTDTLPAVLLEKLKSPSRLEMSICLQHTMDGLTLLEKLILLGHQDLIAGFLIAFKKYAMNFPAGTSTLVFKDPITVLSKLDECGLLAEAELLSTCVDLSAVDLSLLPESCLHSYFAAAPSGSIPYSDLLFSRLFTQDTDVTTLFKGLLAAARQDWPELVLWEIYERGMAHYYSSDALRTAFIVFLTHFDDVQLVGAFLHKHFAGGFFPSLQDKSSLLCCVARVGEPVLYAQLLTYMPPTELYKEMHRQMVTFFTKTDRLSSVFLSQWLELLHWLLSHRPETIEYLLDMNPIIPDEYFVDMLPPLTDLLLVYAACMPSRDFYPTHWDAVLEKLATAICNGPIAQHYAPVFLERLKPAIEEGVLSRAVDLSSVVEMLFERSRWRDAFDILDTHRCNYIPSHAMRHVLELVKECDSEKKPGKKYQYLKFFFMRGLPHCDSSEIDSDMLKALLRCYKNLQRICESKDEERHFARATVLALCQWYAKKQYNSFSSIVLAFRQENPQQSLLDWINEAVNDAYSILPAPIGSMIYYGNFSGSISRNAVDEAERIINDKIQSGYVIDDKSFTPYLKAVSDHLFELRKDEQERIRFTNRVVEFFNKINRHLSPLLELLSIRLFILLGLPIPDEVSSIYNALGSKVDSHIDRQIIALGLSDSSALPNRAGYGGLPQSILSCLFEQLIYPKPPRSNWGESNNTTANLLRALVDLGIGSYLPSSCLSFLKHYEKVIIQRLRAEGEDVDTVLPIMKQLIESIDQRFNHLTGTARYFAYDFFKLILHLPINELLDFLNRELQPFPEVINDQQCFDRLSTYGYCYDYCATLTTAEARKAALTAILARDQQAAFLSQFDLLMLLALLEHAPDLITHGDELIPVRYLTFSLFQLGVVVSPNLMHVLVTHLISHKEEVSKILLDDTSCNALLGWIQYMTLPMLRDICNLVSAILFSCKEKSLSGLLKPILLEISKQIAKAGLNIFDFIFQEEAFLFETLFVLSETPDIVTHFFDKRHLNLFCRDAIKYRDQNPFGLKLAADIFCKWKARIQLTEEQASVLTDWFEGLLSQSLETCDQLPQCQSLLDLAYEFSLLPTVLRSRPRSANDYIKMWLFLKPKAKEGREELERVINEECGRLGKRELIDCLRDYKNRELRQLFHVTVLRHLAETIIKERESTTAVFIEREVGVETKISAAAQGSRHEADDVTTRSVIPSKQGQQPSPPSDEAVHKQKQKRTVTKPNTKLKLPTDDNSGLWVEVRGRGQKPPAARGREHTQGARRTPHQSPGITPRPVAASAAPHSGGTIPNYLAARSRAGAARRLLIPPINLSPLPSLPTAPTSGSTTPSDLGGLGPIMSSAAKAEAPLNDEQSLEKKREPSPPLLCEGPSLFSQDDLEPLLVLNTDPHAHDRAASFEGSRFFQFWRAPTSFSVEIVITEISSDGVNTQAVFNFVGKDSKILDAWDDNTQHSPSGFCLKILSPDQLNQFMVGTMILLKWSDDQGQLTLTPTLNVQIPVKLCVQDRHVLQLQVRLVTRINGDVVKSPVIKLDPVNPELTFGSDSLADYYIWRR